MNQIQKEFLNNIEKGDEVLTLNKKLDGNRLYIYITAIFNDAGYTTYSLKLDNVSQKGERSNKRFIVENKEFRIRTNSSLDNVLKKLIISKIKKNGNDINLSVLRTNQQNNSVKQPVKNLKSSKTRDAKSIINELKERYWNSEMSQKYSTDDFEYDETDEIRSVYLCKYHRDEFDIWWDPDRFDWKYSWALCEYIPNEKFDIWWDPERFNWEEYSWALCEYIPNEKFDIWWDPERFHWEENSYFLCFYLGDKINTWWDPNKFDWKGSSRLTEWMGPDKFNIWWDPDKFDWERGSWYLGQGFVDYFNIWWDPNKFNWKTASWTLCEWLPEKFDQWWDPNKFDWEYGSWFLCKYLPHKFKQWFDPKKFNWDKAGSFIKCSLLKPKLK